MEEIYIKKVKFIKTEVPENPKDKYNSLYFNYTGDEFELLANYANGGTYNDKNADELLVSFSNSLYIKNVSYEKVDVKDITYETLIKKYPSPHSENEDEILHGYEKTVGICKKDDLGNFVYIKNSYCDEKNKTFIIFDVQPFEADETFLDYI
jgi:hypothetical protein